MGNFKLYDKVRKCPQEAQKTIQGGRLNGKTDINPMWRIKTLTEHFGVVGFGWYYDIEKQWLEQGADGEIACFIEISLYINYDDEWSKPIKGVGGNTFVEQNKNGYYTNNECYKMALTDALGVCCKALGMAADIYWDKDKTKYDETPRMPPIICDVCGELIKDTKKGEAITTASEVKAKCGGKCIKCYRAEVKANEG